MNKTLATLLLVFGSATALVAATGWCMVAPGEVMLVRRLGRLVEPPWGPGLHWRYPLGIDRADRVRSDAVRQLTIGLAGTAGSDLEPSAGEVMTGDLNLLRIQATVQYRVVRPADFLLRALEVEPLLTMAAEASVSRALAARGVDAVLRSDRHAIARAVEHDLQRRRDQQQRQEPDECGRPALRASAHGQALAVGDSAHEAAVPVISEAAYLVSSGPTLAEIDRHAPSTIFSASRRSYSAYASGACSRDM